ncbi:MAG: hypothetical protein KBF89_01025 [Acidimicrobiia bacterium]|nr:hypothetical protein [Acidimicrobiia bacterium]
MIIESRDTVSLKPAELDEFGELIRESGYIIPDSVIDEHVEKYTIIVTARNAGLDGFLFGSLERIGGTPATLWSFGAIRPGKKCKETAELLISELYRRSAISFPDEDVLIGTRLAFPSTYAFLAQRQDVVPRPGYAPTGEERNWGRHLAKRFDCESTFDEKTFNTKKSKKSTPLFYTAPIKSTNKVALEIVGNNDYTKGESVVAFGWATADELYGELGHPDFK